MVIYAVFNSLGLEVSVRLVLEDIFYETKDKNPIHLVGRELWETAFSDEGGFSDSDKVRKSMRRYNLGSSKITMNSDCERLLGL